MSKEYTLYTMCNDTRLINLSTLLESNNRFDNVHVKIIPFDSNIKLTTRLCSHYNAEIITVDPKWDDLGKALFKDEEYRKNLMSWRYFRKFNVFNAKNEEIIFLDSNVVICHSLSSVVSMRDSNGFVFGSRSLIGRNFHSWFSFILSRQHKNVKEGFNAGFWSCNTDVFHSVNFRNITRFSGLRQGLTHSPEQSFLSMIIAIFNIPVELIHDIDENVLSMVPGGDKSLINIESRDNSKYLNGKKILTLKWTGGHFTNKSFKIPNSHLFSDLFQDALNRVRSDSVLCGFLEASMDEIL